MSAKELSLEDLLSLEPILSDPVEVQFGGQTTQIVFRELSNDKKNRQRAAAVQYVEDERRKREKNGEGEWRDADLDVATLKAEEQELRMICASMIDPVTKGPACSLDLLRHHMGVQLQEYLSSKYAEFEQSISPYAADDQRTEQLLED